MVRVDWSKEFRSWFGTLNLMEKRLVETRIEKYVQHDHLLNFRILDRSIGLLEFKWNGGMRVYFSILYDLEGKVLLLLLGGNKNSQQRDINKSKKVLAVQKERYEKK